MKTDVVEITVILVVERPDGYSPVNSIDLGEWVADSLGKWVVLPFDQTVRELCAIDILTTEVVNAATFNDGIAVLED